jgi:hypothetical protein
MTCPITLLLEPIQLTNQHYFLGLDLAKTHDFTALAILERAQMPTGEFDHTNWRPILATRFALRHLQRFPLQTSYPKIVDTVCALLRNDPLRAQSTLVIDATGVGAAVVDLFRKARPACTIIPVVITSGDHVQSVSEAKHVPKPDLIASLRLAFQGRKLALSSHLSEINNLRTEIAELCQRTLSSGRPTYSSRSSRAHDDLVMALALAVWKAEPHKADPVFTTPLNTPRPQ